MARRPSPNSRRRPDWRCGCRQFKQPGYIIRSTVVAPPNNLGADRSIAGNMRAVLDYCGGGQRSSMPEGTLVIREGETTGHLFVLVEGRLEVIKGDTVVASIT